MIRKQPDPPSPVVTHEPLAQAHGLLTNRNVMRAIKSLGLEDKYAKDFLRIQEASRLAIEGLCEALASGENSRDCIENYILQELDSWAAVELESVVDIESRFNYSEFLWRWCVEMLPELEADLTAPVKPEIRELFVEKIGPLEGRIAGTVSRIKLTGRIAHWEAKADATLRTALIVNPKAEPPDEHLLNWASISIVFTSDHRVQISGPDRNESLNYTEFGFSDKRTQLPNQAWGILRALAKGRGVLENVEAAGQKWLNVEKRIQKIRGVFRLKFRGRSDPIPYVHGTGYVAAFKISCGPSFDK
jgi:hypothetical protein